MYVWTLSYWAARMDSAVMGRRGQLHFISAMGNPMLV
jgi:hypothetical protein